MNILQLEQERTTLKEKLTAQYSAQARLLFLFSFFDKVLSTSNKNIIDAFLPEFIPEYVFCLKNYSVLGLKPRTCLAGRQVHESIIHQAEQIKNSGHTLGCEDFSGILTIFKNDLEKLQKILHGQLNGTAESKAYFPLLEEGAIKETRITIGILESVTVKIHPAKKENKFIIVPSEKVIEEKISEQINLSWLNAIRIAKKYIKRIHPHHEVIISFDKKVGFCKGNSLGTALTLSFIEEIFKTYNSPVSIRVGDGIAFTGGMDEQGNITDTSEEIIKQKTELVFFSDTALFIVPKKEESAANEKLNELRKEFPQRDLKIIGIEDINDLLDRRTIVEIKKQPVVIRGRKFLRKNWAALSVVFVLLIVIFLFVLRDIDNNPYTFTIDTSKTYIKNKAGKVLWTKNLGVPKQYADEANYMKGLVKIVDIDSDGNNEVIFAGTKNEPETDEEFFPLICYSSLGKMIWKYSFKDTVNSKREKLLPVYGIVMIDTLTFNGNKCLFVIAANSPSFSSAIFSLDLKTGKRLPGTLWCSGHTYAGLIKDINNDNKKDILCVGLDNGFEDAVFFGFDIDTTIRVRPTTTTYLLNNFPVADLITYIRFPKTDYDLYKNFRTPGIYSASFIDYSSQEYYQFYTMDYLDDDASCLWYQIDYNLKDVNVIVDSRFRIMRDSLVAHGKLQPPYTDTPEYVELIKSKILYYKNGKWVKREELE